MASGAHSELCDLREREMRHSYISSGESRPRAGKMEVT